MTDKPLPEGYTLDEVIAALQAKGWTCTPSDDEREAARAYADTEYPELRLAPENEDRADIAERAFLAGAGFRRTAVQEPSAEPTVRDHVRDLTGATDAELDELGGLQGEPSDAEVFAAAREYHERGNGEGSFERMADHVRDSLLFRMRAALRAAYEEGKKR